MRLARAGLIVSFKITIPSYFFPQLKKMAGKYFISNSKPSAALDTDPSANAFKKRAEVFPNLPVKNYF